MIIVAHDAPIYIHCYDGTHITGMIIMCLRKLQCWDVSTVHAEFSRFMRGGIITNEESQFVSSFNGNACEHNLALGKRGFNAGSGDGIGLPLHLPEWLWQGEHVRLLRAQTASTLCVAVFEAPHAAHQTAPDLHTAPVGATAAQGQSVVGAGV
jgi:hypothetical protein